MKILYANVIEKNTGWGSEVFLDAALLSNGHDTQTIDYRVNRHSLAREFSRAKEFDIFFLQRGDYFPLGIVQTVQRPRIFYFSELILRCRDADHLFQSNLFNYYFVRSINCKNKLIEKGWVPKDKIGILLSSFDPDTYCSFDVEKKYDILFLGSITRRRKEILSELGRRFNIKTMSAFGAEAARLFNQAKIVINIHAEEYLDTETRVYEVLGTRSFLISEQLSRESPFKSGIHLVEVNGQEELEAKLQYYLSKPDERNRIAEAGYREVITKHTYNRRAQEIIEVMEDQCDGARMEMVAINKQKLKQYKFRTEVPEKMKILTRNIMSRIIDRAKGLFRR